MGKGRGGFPGGMPGNMNNLMKQAQRMQRQMEQGYRIRKTRSDGHSDGQGSSRSG